MSSGDGVWRRAGLPLDTPGIRRPQTGSDVLQILILRVVLAVEPSERATDVERRRNRGAALRHEPIERHRIRRVEGWWLVVGARRLRDSLAATADRVRQML